MKLISKTEVGKRTYLVVEYYYLLGLFKSQKTYSTMLGLTWKDEQTGKLIRDKKLIEWLKMENIKNRDSSCYVFPARRKY